jgi:hypothetical protein
LGLNFQEGKFVGPGQKSSPAGYLVSDFEHINVFHLKMLRTGEKSLSALIPGLNRSVTWLELFHTSVDEGSRFPFFGFLKGDAFIGSINHGFNPVHSDGFMGSEHSGGIRLLKRVTSVHSEEGRLFLSHPNGRTESSVMSETLRFAVDAQALRFSHLFHNYASHQTALPNNSFAEHFINSGRFAWIPMRSSKFSK